MDQSEDVERLFSWLKAPMVHYREFAPQIEVAEAVATWPLVHKAAVQTGVSDDEAAPHGDSVVKERMARDRMMMPTGAAQAIRETPLPGTESQPIPGGIEDDASAERFPPPLQHVAQPEPSERAVEFGAEPPPPRPEPRRPASSAAAASAARRPEPVVPRTVEPVAAPRDAGFYPAADRAALFGGEYRGREREAPRQRAADRQDRSLDAVFTRLSGGRDRLPDPRERARTTPGLGSVFGRLR
jgi:hypothetical protein